MHNEGSKECIVPACTKASFLSNYWKMMNTEPKHFLAPKRWRNCPATCGEQRAALRANHRKQSRLILHRPQLFNPEHSESSERSYSAAMPS